MKFRHILTGTFFTISLLAAAAFTSFAAVSKGRFETVDATAITGWAYNSDKSDDALNVQIVITNKNTGEEVFESVVSAGEYRQNLYDQYMGNGCHGFTINIDWTNYPQGVYLVEGTVGSRKFSNTRTYTNGSSDTAESSQTASGDLKLVPLGVFKTTGYCPCKSCSEGWGRHTSTGAMAASGHTIAVDPRVIPYGSQIMINGVIYTAEDKGGGVKGKHIDIFFDTHGETRQHGMQNAEVYLVQS
ncbi:MAG: 3D domain-containing protein [Clostridium sp.]|nr:3D domain-containing protein [Clostridium sp.]